MIRRPRAVTFDFHDTIAIAPAWFALEVRQLPAMVLQTLVERRLIDHDGARAERATEEYRALRRAIQGHGREMDALAGVQHALKAVGVALPDAPVADVIDALMADARADASPRPGIVEAVTALAAAGVPMAVISNAVYHPYLEWCLDDWGLTPHFTAVISSASCGYYKSHSGIYHAAMHALASEPAEIVHIGDSYRFDVEAAHALGMGTIWLNLSAEERAENVAGVTITDLTGLASTLLHTVEVNGSFRAHKDTLHGQTT